MAGESFAGITVPEGEPGAVRQAATIFTGAAGGLQDVASGLQAVPNALSDWRGPASASFRGATITNGAALQAGVEAMHDAARAAREYAEELENAQRDARQAIRAARDAQDRIDQAEADIAAAQSAQTQAAARLDAANHRVAMSSMHGAPDAGALADVSAAGDDIAAAESAEANARARLERAQDDLAEAQRRGQEAEEAARQAARRAGGAFSGLSGSTPAAAILGGSPALLGARTIGRLRAGDYSALRGLPLNYLSERDQRTIAAIVARDVREAQYGDGDENIADLSGFVERYQHDDEFATGFYNELGGREASQLMFNVGNFAHANGEGWDDPSLVALMAPFATLLGTATRSRELRRDFTDDFLGIDVPIRDRIPGHEQLESFIRSGDAAGYDVHFLARVGQELMIEPLVHVDAPPHMELSERQDFMEFMAGSPEAAGLLLEGVDSNGHANVATLMLYGPRYTDDGAGLGSLIEAGTHDLMGINRDLALRASEPVIKVTPTFAEHLPGQAKDALVAVLDSNMAGFEHAAVDEAWPERGYELGHNVDLTYEEASEYLKALLADERTADDTATLVGTRVGDQIFDATGLEGDSRKNELMERAGSLQEMTTLAGVEGDVANAEEDASANKLKSEIASRAIDVAGGKILGRLPGTDIAVGAGLDRAFPTDQVEQALVRAREADHDAEQQIRRLVMAGEVAHGHLPDAALQALDAPGGVESYDFNRDGDDDDFIQVDRDGDGRTEPIRERELHDLVNAEHNGNAALSSMQKLEELQYARDNPPGVEEFEDALPDGYHLDRDWLSDDDIHRSDGDEPEVDYSIERDRADYVLTLHDPERGDVQVRVTREEREWVPAP
jgi:uncharacterized protein YukE